MGNAFRLKNGSIFVAIETPGGIYNSSQLKKISELSQSGAAIIKATEDQRLGLFIAEDQLAKTVELCQTVGLTVRNYQDGLHQPVSCIGQLCADHEQDAQGAAMSLTE